MSALNDLSIGKKLSALLLLGILGLAAYIGFVFHTAMAVRGHSTEARQAYPLLLQAGAVGRATTEMRDLFTVAVTSQDSDMLFAARQQQGKVQDLVERLSDDAARNGISLAGLTGAFRAYARAADGWAAGVIEGSVPPAEAQARLYDLSQRQQAFARELDASREAINAVFASRLARIERDADRTWQLGLFGGIAISLVMLGFTRTLSRHYIVAPLEEALAAVGRLAAGDWEQPLRARGRDEIGRLQAGMETLRLQLRARREADRRDDYRARLLAELHVQLRGDHGVEALCARWLQFLAPRLGGEIGLVYVADDGLLQPRAAYALRLDQVAPVPRGQALVGQVAHTGTAIHLDAVPEHYPRQLLAGGMLRRPRHLAILPVHGDGEVLAVLELGLPAPLDDERQALLADCSEHFAVALRLARSRDAARARPALAAVAS